MKTLRREDIENIINNISLKSENLNKDVFMGDGKNKKVVVKDGLKIRHIPSGLTYTVLDMKIDDSGNPTIVCSRPGKKMVISKNEFNQYERQ